MRTGRSFLRDRAGLRAGTLQRVTAHSAPRIARPEAGTRRLRTVGTVAQRGAPPSLARAQNFVFETNQWPLTSVAYADKLQSRFGKNREPGVEVGGRWEGRSLKVGGPRGK